MQISKQRNGTFFNQSVFETLYISFMVNITVVYCKLQNVYKSVSVTILLTCFLSLGCLSSRMSDITSYYSDDTNNVVHMISTAKLLNYLTHLRFPLHAWLTSIDIQLNDLILRTAFGFVKPVIFSLICQVLSK